MQGTPWSLGGNTTPSCQVPPRALNSTPVARAGAGKAGALTLGSGGQGSSFVPVAAYEESGAGPEKTSRSDLTSPSSTLLNTIPVTTRGVFAVRGDNNPRHSSTGSFHDILFVRKHQGAVCFPRQAKEA